MLTVDALFGGLTAFSPGIVLKWMPPRLLHYQATVEDTLLEHPDRWLTEVIIFAASEQVYCLQCATKLVSERDMMHIRQR